MIEVKGSEACVALAVAEIQAFLLENASEKLPSLIQLSVPTKAFPAIIGTKGTKAQELTQLSGARFDLDREKQMVTIKGISIYFRNYD
jgi:polyribonucleotide nucleotidyltransferase